ncbi:MAG: ATP-binding protein [Cyanobacteria bacterium P01_D01_bin.73]
MSFNVPLVKEVVSNKQLNSAGKRRGQLGIRQVKKLGEQFAHRFEHQKIAYKIALGYALSIGIAVVGVSAGLIVGALREDEALIQRDITAQNAEWIFRLSNESSPLALLYPQQLLNASEQWGQLHYRVAQSMDDIAKLRSSVSGLEAFIKENSSSPGVDQGLSVTRPMRLFLDEYELWIEPMWQALGSSSGADSFESQLAKDRIVLLRDEMNTPRAKELQEQLQRMSSQLSQLKETAVFLEQAALEDFQAARHFRIWIVIASLAGATALAAICATSVSRAIAHPIGQLTAQTRRITDEQNFELRVSVKTEDETAQLAASIDQLVRWAGQYTQDLKTAQETLEQRVERRTRELRAAQAQMIQSEKMSSLGQLVAGVAHEINNPVGFIYSNVNHATEYVGDLLDVINLYRSEYEETEVITAKLKEVDLPFLEEDVTKLLESMKVGAERIKQIVLSLRTFARLDESELKLADLHKGLDSTLTILGHRFKGSGDRPAIEIIRDYGDLPLVNCYAGQLNQVFMNIIINAIDAFEGSIAAGKNPNLSDSKELGNSAFQPQLTIHTHSDGDRCLISISDNGPGIAPSVRHQLFDPFVTTKEVGKGTGMGLAVSYQIVADRHHGKLSCVSTPGQGTAFIIEVPINVALINAEHEETLVH